MADAYSTCSGETKHLQAVKDGIVGIVPIIIIGSFCLVPTGIGNLVGED